MLRRSRIVVGNVRFTSIVIVTTTVFLAGSAVAGETLYNGIELPNQWLPRRDELKREPMPEAGISRSTCWTPKATFSPDSPPRNVCPSKAMGSATRSDGRKKTWQVPNVRCSFDFG